MLVSSAEYKRLKKQNMLGDICNGMGPANSLITRFIPNTMYGLDVSECGDIHDFDYFRGKTIEDKNKADRVFLNNMLRMINNASRWLRWLRRRRAIKYYLAVKHFGGPAFWAGKNDGES